MGEPAPAEAAPAEDAPDEDDDSLSEMEILKRMGNLPLEAGEAGLKGFFLNTENYIKYGLVDQKEESDEVHFSGTRRVKPYRLISKKEVQEEIKRTGFQCDFHCVQKDVEKFPGPELLLIRDPDRIYENNFVWISTKPAFQTWMEKIEEIREKIIAAHVDSLTGGGGGGAGGASGGRDFDGSGFDGSDGAGGSDLGL